MAHNTFATVISAALLSMGAATVAQAQTNATVVIQSGHPPVYGAVPVQVQYGPPPPPRREVVPPPRRGQVWVPGHWEWRGNRHVWMEGYWVKARPGHRYREPRWVERNGRWEFRQGGWDRDGDGVPNRHDSRPDNPYRR